MLKWAAIFLIIAILAAALGFSGLIAGTAATFAKILFGLFIIMFIVSLITGRK